MVIKSFENNKVSIIIRTLGSNKKNIERAIFSVFCSTYKEKEIVIVYQGKNGNEFETYVDYLKSIYEIGIDFKLCINSNYSEDQRAKNINIGIDNANGRFISFLDDDDCVSPNHYEDLINLINIEKYVWGYSICLRNICDEDYIIKKQNIYFNNYDFEELLIHNYIPIHSFIIDRNSILHNPEIIKTNEFLTRLEDYYILLNLASKYNPIINKKIGVFYNFNYAKEDENEKCKELLKCREVLKDLIVKIKITPLIQKKPKKKLSILFRVIIIALSLIPKFGERIISNKKYFKYIKDIENYKKYYSIH